MRMFCMRLIIMTREVEPLLIVSGPRRARHRPAAKPLP